MPSLAGTYAPRRSVRSILGKVAQLIQRRTAAVDVDPAFGPRVCPCEQGSYPASSAPRLVLDSKLGRYPPHAAKARASPAAEEAAATVADRIRDVAIPESNDNLHPRVQAWIAGHKNGRKSSS